MKRSGWVVESRVRVVSCHREDLRPLLVGKTGTVVGYSPRGLMAWVRFDDCPGYEDGLYFRDDELEDAE